MTFEAAAGSIPGRDHVGAGRLLVGRNNQDAWAWLPTAGGGVAVVCDGCSGGARSEVGAALGARFVAEAAVRCAAPGPATERLEAVRREVLARLRRLAADLDGPRADVVHDHFLFTVVAADIGAEETCLFAAGDGVVFVNGERTDLGPFPGNAPPYVGYGLLGEEGDAGPRFEVLRRLPTAELRSLLVGSDGAADLARLADRRLPGSAERVGPISRFWECDLYFRNRDGIRRRLALLNSPGSAGGVQEPGLLRDDTTLVAVRRRREG